jgi:hypothetical protein
VYFLEHLPFQFLTLQSPQSFWRFLFLTDIHIESHTRNQSLYKSIFLCVTLWKSILLQGGDGTCWYMSYTDINLNPFSDRLTMYCRFRPQVSYQIS